jgi:hypothetical protein
MGVRLMNLASGNTVVALARNAESAAEDAVADDDGPVADDSAAEVENTATTEDIADDGNESGDVDV